MISPQEKFDSLKDLLLADEREHNKKLLKKIDALKAILEQREKLSKRISPIIEEHVEEFSKSIPETVGPEITKALKVQIEESKDQVVEALYPIMGKMVKRFIQNELAILSEKINTQVNRIFSFKTFKRKIASFFTGIKENDIILSELMTNDISQIFVIQKKSGILLGVYSKKETIDKDLVSGMLTAIKNFAGDAFKSGSQNIETIEYELFNIQIKNFHTYYIAIVVSGTLTNRYKSKLDTNLNKLAGKINRAQKLNDPKKINKLLKSHFKL